MEGSVSDERGATIKGRRGAALRVLAAVAVLVVLYAAVGFFLVPAVARHILTRYVETDLKARVALRELRFNPFTLRVVFGDFALTTSAGSPLVSFQQLQIQGALSSLWHGAWTLRELQLDRPSLEMAIERDGALNWTELLRQGAGAQAVQARSSSPPSQGLPALRIDVLRIRGGRVHFEDQSRASPFSTVVDPVELELLDFRTTPGSENGVRLSARLTTGEQLAWSGQFSLQPLSSTGTLQLSGLSTRTLASYLQNALPCALPSGSLEASARYQWAQGARGGAAGSAKITLERLVIHDLALAPKAPVGAGATAAPPLIVLPQIQVNNADIDLITHRIDVAQVSLHQPTVRAARGPDGALSLQRLMGPPAAAGTGAAVTTAAAAAPIPVPASGSGGRSSTTTAAMPPWQLTLQQFTIDGADLELEDHSVAPAAQLRVRDLSVQLRGYSSAPSAGPVTFDLNARVGDAGQLRSHGQLDTSAQRVQLSIALQRLDLTALRPYIARQTSITLYRGNLSADAQVRYASARDGAQPKLALEGGLTLSDLATRERHSNSELVSWQSLALSGVRYQHQPDRLHIHGITLRQAVGRVLIGPDGTLNLAQVLRSQSAGAPGSAAKLPSSSAASSVRARVVSASAAPATTSSSTPSSSASASMPIVIDRIDVSGSAANFTDQSVRPSFSAAILGLHGSIVNLSSDPKSRARLQLAGQVERYAPVTISGEVNLLAATTYTDVSMSFSNIDLTLFNPYSGKFAGYSIEQGKLSTQMHYHVEQNKLDASHHIVVDQLEFGPATATKPAVPLPIKLAVALLKDRHGVIDLNLPVTGSLHDPSFRLAPIIGRVLLNLITKAVTAPFAWIGSLTGGGQQLSYVDFAAGSSQLPDPERQRIAQLAKALNERPQLKLDVPLHTISVADDRALAQQALGQAETQETAAASAVTPGHAGRGGTARAARRRGAASGTRLSSPELVALETLYRQQFQAEPEFPAAVVAGPSVASSSTGSAPTAAAPAVTVAAASAPALPVPQTAADPRIDWLKSQLLPKFAPSGAQRTALGRARADAVEAAVLADKQLTPERVFLTERLSGGGSVGMSRMELQLQ